jgi:charged multivesicular body protein 5
MNRLFGSAPKAPKATAESAIAKLDEGVARLDVQIAELNSQIKKDNETLMKARKGSASWRIYRERLRAKLTKRKNLEEQRSRQDNQINTMQQAQMTQDNLKSVMVMVDAMKTTNKELKKQYGKVDIDKIERLQDEMADLMDVGNEIQESLSSAYGVPDEVDEEELDAELEMLGAEMEMEGGMADASGVPDFMRDEVPDFIDEAPETKKVEEAAR